MSLQNKIENKLSEALKLKDKATYSTLRLVVAALKDQLIARKIKDKNTLPDADLINLLKKWSNKEMILAKLTKAGREELLKVEQKEIEIINNFLPKQLNDEEKKNM